MNIYFNMVGKLSIGKETDTFKPYSEQKFQSGWTSRTLNFNCLSGDNRFRMQVRGGHQTDINKDDFVYVFTKRNDSEKGETIRLDFKDRLKFKDMNLVPDYRKYIIDLEVPGRRWKIENCISKHEAGEEVNESDLKEIGLDNVGQLDEAFVKSKALRFQFLSQWDYAEFLNRVITSGKYDKEMFHISGVHMFEYNENKGTFYEHFEPQNIYRVSNVEEKSTESIKFYFNKESFVEYEEKNKTMVLGKVMVYDGKRKSDIPCDYTLTINRPSDNSDPKFVKQYEKICSMFKVNDGSWKEVGIVVDLLDGAQRKKITFDDLDEDTQENILLELTTLEDVQRELGGTMYGKKVKESRFSKLARGYCKSGVVDTVYDDEYFKIKSLNEDVNVFEDNNDEDDIDLFDGLDI